MKLPDGNVLTFRGERVPDPVESGSTCPTCLKLAEIIRHLAPEHHEMQEKLLRHGYAIAMDQIGLGPRGAKGG